eukprot:s865_g32.t1
MTCRGLECVEGSRVTPRPNLGFLRQVGLLRWKPATLVLEGRRCGSFGNCFERLGLKEVEAKESHFGVVWAEVSLDLGFGTSGDCFRALGCWKLGSKFEDAIAVSVRGCVEAPEAGVDWLFALVTLFSREVAIEEGTELWHSMEVESTQFHKVRELSSVVFLEENLQAGGRLEKTVDLFGLVGMCVLVHSDPMVLASDIATIRSMEENGSLFGAAVAKHKAQAIDLNLLLVFMIFVPSLLWQIFVGSFFAAQYSVLIPILGFMLQVSSLYLLLATALSDPGIMPRQKDFTEHYDERSKVWRTREPQRFYDVLLRGHPLKLKYCKTCNIYRPPRCTHCSVCENCVERFDHHCPWLGNCIGKRNYRLFYGFVSTTGALNILVLATAVAQLAIRASEIAEELQVGAGDAFGQALLREAMAAVLSIYALGIVWFTFGLCAYHNWLVCDPMMKPSGPREWGVLIFSILPSVDLRLVHALGLSIPSSHLLEKFGHKLRSAPAVGVRRQPPAMPVMVNPDGDNGNGGIPAAVAGDYQNLLGNSAAGGDGDATADVKDEAGQQ